MNGMKKKIGFFLAFLLVVCGLILIFWLKSGINAEKPIAQLFHISQEVRQHFKNRPDYWGLNSDFFTEKNLINKSNQHKMLNEFGKEIVIGTDFDGYKVMPGGRSFDIVYKNLNKEECVALLSYKLSEEQSVSLLSLKLKRGEDVIEFGWGAENKLPVSTDVAKKLCQENVQNEILWTFE
ncbi:MAG: hypothetical protein PHE89_02245 [Alphaproteobacteria bacterium]|nr:hypothetical protein [Alphaproteobacteria bacterium]